jgi:Fe-S-cluster containining protein
MMPAFAETCRDLTAKGTCKGDCCGLLAFTPAFLKEHAQRMQKPYKPFEAGGEIYTFTEDGHCPFLDPERKCAIYAHRPPVCHRYGITVELPCPYIKANGRPRSPAGRRHVQRQINHTVDSKLKEIKHGKAQSIRKGGV